jgi:glycerophosphoryl diester phosphodiesterase
MKKLIFSGWIAVYGMIGMSAGLGTEIIAHRGASSEAPENTLSSFKRGYALKADAVELDIHLTKDGKIVVLHDFDTGRLAGVEEKVEDQTLAELRRLDVGQWGPWKGKGFSEKIPTLEEVLALIPEGQRLFIEIKPGPEILPELTNVLARSGKRPEQTAINGFGYETMRAAKARFPELQVYWLVAPDDNDANLPGVNELIQQAKAARLDGLDLHFGFPIDKSFVGKVHAAGLKVYTWTVNDAGLARRQAEAGVDGIATDNCSQLREQLAAKA